MTVLAATILDHFQCLPDPRIERTKEHRLTDLARLRQFAPDFALF